LDKDDRMLVKEGNLKAIMSCEWIWRINLTN